MNKPPSRQSQAADPADAPHWLRRRRARLAPALPRWIDWHFALLLVAVLVIGAIVWVLSPILAPFLAAAILAYIFDPLVDRMERRGLSRSLATIVAVLLLALAVVLLLVIVLPLFYKEVAQLTQLIQGFVEQLKNTVVPWVNAKLGTAIQLDASSFRTFMQENISDASGIAKRVFATVGSGGLAVVAVLINISLVPIVLFYLLRDWDELVARVDELVPRRYHQTVNSVASEVDAVLSEFLRGQLTVMLIMATFYVVGLWAVGLKFALPVGLITGLLVFVPYLGVALGLVLGTVAAVMQFDSVLTGLALVWAVFAVGQVVESLFVTPKFVGERIGLHPVAVIFALMAFGQLFGFFGVLLALPASAAILVGLRHVAVRYKGSAVFQRQQ
ncbi:MAG: AI-2E family transporter [Burkholderiales bacterium]|nr:AI-2E family transporter [Nitrosomonadaceae bacterium]